MTRILVIDNYDSFVFTLVGYIQQLGAETTVIRNDEYELDSYQARRRTRRRARLSRPRRPAEAGVIIDTIRWAAEAKKPLLGVCLGHQAIAEAFRRHRHPRPRADAARPPLSCTRTSPCSGRALPLHATRYHSPGGRTGNHARRPGTTSHHRQRHHHGPAPPRSPMHGVQFHPESVLTESGYLMLGNWLEETGLQGAAERAKSLSPLMA